MSRVGPRLAFIGVFAASVCAFGARASVISLWNQPDGGFFNNGENWLNLAVPGFADEAHFRLGASYTVHFSLIATNARAVIATDRVVFELDGHIYGVVGGDDPTLYVAHQPTDDATLTVRGGRLESTDVLIGGDPAARGELIIEGALGRFAPFRKVVVGERGVGTLTLRDGARMTMVGGAGGVSIGLAPGSDGFVRVEGGQTRMTLGSPLIVGEGGFGRFEVANGAIVSTTNGVIGGAAGGDAQASLRGDATRWTVNGDLDVGLFGGAASLTLEQGATVEATRVRIGANGTLGGHGVVRAAVFNEGTITTDAAAALTIDGALTLGSASMVRARLHGAESSSAAMFISGSASIGGLLAVEFEGGPAAGSAFDVLFAPGGVLGEFDAFTHAGLGAGLSAYVGYKVDRVRVVVVPAPGVAAAALLAACAWRRERRV